MCVLFDTLKECIFGEGHSANIRLVVKALRLKAWGHILSVLIKASNGPLYGRIWHIRTLKQCIAKMVCYCVVFVRSLTLWRCRQHQFRGLKSSNNSNSHLLWLVEHQMNGIEKVNSPPFIHRFYRYWVKSPRSPLDFIGQCLGFHQGILLNIK